MLMPFHDPIRPPLDVSFNEATASMARRLNPCGWDVVTDAQAPGSLDHLTCLIAEIGRIAVSGDYCEKTAYGDPEINIAARAWHDWVHWRHQLPFTLEGETAVAWVQIGQLREAGLWTPFRQAFILTEVVEQAKFFSKTGSFPEDQWAFTIDHLGAQGFSHNDMDQALAPLWRAYQRGLTA